MPLTPFQKNVLRLLAAHRNPENYVAGGAVINRADSSPRYSGDLDFFHDTAESVLASAEADAAALVSQGFTVEWLLRQPLLYKARVTLGGDGLRLDWCYDSAFRFFPVQPDSEFGYCLHPADAATNKALALAGRSEIRDFLDILYLHEHYLSFGALCWAACGKDLGFTPWLLVDLAKRNMKFRQEHLAEERLVQHVDLTELKQKWLETAAEAEEWFTRLPAAEVGCLYLRPDLTPFSPDPDKTDFKTATRHFGSLKGVWPQLGSE